MKLPFQKALGGLNSVGDITSPFPCPNPHSYALNLPSKSDESHPQALVKAGSGVQVLLLSVSLTLPCAPQACCVPPGPVENKSRSSEVPDGFC